MKTAIKLSKFLDNAIQVSEGDLRDHDLASKYTTTLSKLIGVQERDLYVVTSGGEVVIAVKTVYPKETTFKPLKKYVEEMAESNGYVLP